jgi:polar amino acid transport system ATP-binding protein
MKLEARNLRVNLGGKTVLDSVNFATGSSARVLALLGPSGGGKSTLLRALGGLVTAQEGLVLHEGEVLPPHLEVRRRFGFVFQSFNLFPHLSVRQNIELPLCEVHGHAPAEARQRADELLQRLGLEQRASHRSAELSGGQQQRAAIARALAPRPSLLFLDEPTSALDPVMTAEVLEVVRELAAAGQQIVLATHEIRFARLVADWVIFIESGRVLHSGPASDFFERPSCEQARKYLDGLARYR